MRDSKPVVLKIREAYDGFPEDVSPLRDASGRLHTFPDDETAEKVAARLNRTGMLTASAYLKHTRFVAGWIPEA
jgi:hypothetical protein